MGVEDDPNVEGTSPLAKPAHGSGSAGSARAVAHSNYDDGRESIDIMSEEFRSSSVIGGEDQRQDFRGNRPQNEDDVLQVCRSLRAALQREGEAWGPFSLWPSSQDNVDAFARNDAEAVLRVQVTRVEREAWDALAKAKDHQATLQRSVVKLAAAIQAAVDSKGDPSPQRRKGIPPAERSKLLLALDAIRSPGYVHDTVVAAFLANHREWATSLGFRAIWLVGPTAALTRRLC